MIETTSLALILLLLRLLATGLIIATIARQIHNIRTLQTQFPAVRYTILFMTIVILLGQIIPIMIDATALFDRTYVEEGDRIGWLLGAYTLNNATADVVVGALLAYLHYRIPPRSRESSTDIKQSL